MKIVIIGTDDRYAHLADLLRSREGVSCFNSCEEFIETEEYHVPIDLLFLPIGKLVHQQELIIPETDTHVWSRSRQPLQKPVNTTLFHYTEDEDWLWSNAELTADAFLSDGRQKQLCAIESRLSLLFPRTMRLD